MIVGADRRVGPQWESMRDNHCDSWLSARADTPIRYALAALLFIAVRVAGIASSNEIIEVIM